MKKHWGIRVFFPIIIWRKGERSVGWSVANALLQSGFRSTLDSPRHFQTSEGTNRNNFYINPDHPRRPQTPLTELQKIQILADFQICQRTLTPTVLIGQLQLWPRGTKKVRHYMEWLFWAKRLDQNIERWPSAAWGKCFSLSLFREKAKWSVGWSVANVLLQSGFRSTLDSPRHFQTSEGTNRNNFYVNPDHPRRPQTPLTKFQKIQILTDFGICQTPLRWAQKFAKLRDNLWSPQAELSETH